MKRIYVYIRRYVEENKRGQTMKVLKRDKRQVALLVFAVQREGERGECDVINVQDN